MGASEARNGRGSPGDQTLQKVRAVEVVHVDRFLDLDLVLGAVKMGPVTWRQDCVRTRIIWTVTLSIGSGWWVVSGLRICARNSNDRFKRKSGRCTDWGRGKEWAAGGRGCGVGGGGAGSMPGYGRKEAAPPAPRAVMSARPTSRRWSLGDEPISMGNSVVLGPASRWNCRLGPCENLRKPLPVSRLKPWNSR